MRRPLSSKSSGRLVHHLDEEERDILKPLAAKLNDDIQCELALQFISAEPYASEKPHPELSKKAEKAPGESIQVGLEEKQAKH